VSSPRVSIVIASRDRKQLLSTALAAVRLELVETACDCEIVVVDDGSAIAYEQSALDDVTLVRGRGEGPAMARNRGVAVARGEIIFFTDDDAVVQPGWLANGLAFLDVHPDFAGVSGDTSSPEYNPLYEHSVADHVGASYLTCNVAYRRSALVSVGGFDRRFAHAHEDRDVAWRIETECGPVGFEPLMKVVHPGRAFSVRSAWKRAFFIYDDWLLFQRYPQRRAASASIRWSPLRNTLRTWRNVASSRKIWRRPRELIRWLMLAGGQLSICAFLTIFRWRHMSQRGTHVVGGLARGARRIAYVGPSPHPQAPGAPGVAGLLLDQLLQRGYSIDCYVAASVEDDDPRGLGERDGLNYIIGHSSFVFGRWYSRHRLSKMMSLQLFAGVNRRRLSHRLSAEHDAAPYDFVYQFSTFESVGVPRKSNLPVLIHPSVHAGGERRWLLRESTALSNDSAARRKFVATWLAIRSFRQGIDARRATGIIALSEPFAQEIESDYRVSSDRVRIVGNCINVDALTRSDPRNRDVVVVGRLAVRKGLEDVVALSHLIAPLEPPLHLRIIGAPSLWSDYRLALQSVDPTVTTVQGGRSRDQVFEDIAGALALLQLSRYEPFGLTVAEALALGVPVIVTPAVGAAVHVAADVKIVVAPGDIDALLLAVTSLADLREDERTLLSHRCRHEAERLFSPSVVADQLELVFSELLD
jgi:glycosyltransferase involved in cell wall biosynthesis/GT2 family glycosyltransferase